MNAFDVIVVGTGAAGLSCALALDPHLNVLVITKTILRECNSWLAQGGIVTVLNDGDKASFIDDTLRAGRYEGDPRAVGLLADRAQGVLDRLLAWNMPLATENGQVCHTREGGHSESRIVYARDETGRYLIETLAAEVGTRKNITLWENTSLVDLLEDRTTRACRGIMVERDGQVMNLYCPKTVLACGGIGALFKNSTNQKTVRADAIAIAHAHGIALKNLGYIQFHPTTLYDSASRDQRFLLSEALRGEGAYLLNPAGQRFTNELSPRDVVTSAILEEQKKAGTPHVYLDISHKHRDYLVSRFPHIYEQCLGAGYDFTRDRVPVTPSQHYHMGGIQVDLKGRTSMPNLYAIGEVSCTGVHGANRLASNSLLEALVYGQESAQDINRTVDRSSPVGQDFIVYPELRDPGYRSDVAKSLIAQERKGRSDDVFTC